MLIQLGGLSQAALQVSQAVVAVLGYDPIVNADEIFELVRVGVRVLDSCEGALEDVDAVLDLLLIEPEKGPGNLLLGETDEVALARVLAATTSKSR